MKKVLGILTLLLNLSICQTSDQINQAKRIIKSKGLSKEQVIEQAKLSGYSNEQINEAMKKDLNKKIMPKENLDNTSKELNVNFDQTSQKEEKSPILNSSNNDVKVNNDNGLQYLDSQDLEIIDESYINIDSQSQYSSENVSYFGYEIFKRDPALFQAASVGAIDPDYLIGPGDEIIVMLWGETQFRQVLEVNREGFIFIPEVGQAFVNGLNMNLLESKLFRILSQSYASLNPSGGKPTTFLDISLGNLRPLRIQVLGEVSQPGAYTVSPSSTLFSSLYYFNGPTTLGSLREIQLIRGGENISNIDFYDYLLTGKSPNDLKLQLDDVIFVPRRMKTVTIKGEINRPGIYELKPGETLKDILSMAGDLKITAYLDRIQIDRIVPFEKREELGMDRMYTDFNLRDLKKTDNNFPLQDGDVIQIFSVLNLRQNVVDISGAVTRPGSYDIGESLTLSQLIIKSDSLLGDAYMDRIDIVRIKPDFTEELIRLDLDKVMDNDPKHDIELMGLDRVKVYGRAEMVSQKYVSISGHVKRPGRYSLQQNMTLYDLIFKAGGYIDPEFKKDAYLDRAELVRIDRNSGEKKIIPFNLLSVLNKTSIAFDILEPNDAVRIYSNYEIKGGGNFIYIEGNVKRPGQYDLYEKNMTLYDLIFKAGGLNDSLYRANTILQRADLIRFSDDRLYQQIIPFNLKNVILDKNNKENYKLYPDDRVRIYSKEIFNKDHFVTINGMINTPGRFKYKKGMTIKDLILECGGVSRNIYRYKIEIARIDTNNSDVEDKDFAKSIQIELDNNFDVLNSTRQVDLFQNKMSQSKENEFELAPYDYISVRPDPSFEIQKIITVEGAVRYPGLYVKIKQDERISDIILRAGGLKDNAFLEGSIFERDNKRVNVSLAKIMRRSNHSSNAIVQSGDRIQIVENPNTIIIEGEISSPGTYYCSAQKKLKKVIREAGGLTPNADEKNIVIVYPNGSSKKYIPFLNNPKVTQGSRVIVGLAAEEEPFDSTEFLKEISSIMASFAQAIAIVILAKG